MHDNMATSVLTLYVWFPVS